VSVVLPVYNAERYLATALDSLLNQTYGDFEIIAVDDGSTDRSVDILNRYADRDGRIRVLRRPQETLGAVLDEGVGEARGTYIARMDADDVAYPDRFEAQVRYLRAHSDVGIVGGQTRLIDPEGFPLGPAERPLSHDAIETALLQGEGAAMEHPAVMMRTAVVRKVGGYPRHRETSEDVDLYLRIAECARLANLPKTLLDYRLRPDSICHTQYDQQVVDTRDIIRGALRRRGQTDCDVPSLDVSRDESFNRPAYLRLQWCKRALRAGHGRSALHQVVEALRTEPEIALDPSIWSRVLVPSRFR
jgi:glycosyltransferase involved in cell wall biosynthesis